MPEPRDSLLAFLADLHEQVDLFERTSAHPFAGLVLSDLRARLLATASVVDSVTRSIAER